MKLQTAPLNPSPGPRGAELRGPGRPEAQADVALLRLLVSQGFGESRVLGFGVVGSRVQGFRVVLYEGLRVLGLRVFGL